MKMYGDRVKLHANVPQDVLDSLVAWAGDNASSMTAELVRSVRERARREAEQREQVR